MIQSHSLNYQEAGLNKSIELNSNFFLAYNTLGETYKLQALYEIDKGSDPTSFVNDAIKHLKKGTEVNPQNVDGFIRQANAYSIQAEYETASKRDPSSYLEGAREALKKADELAPTMPEVHAAKAEIEAASAGWKISQGQQKLALEEIQRGLKSTETMLAENPRAANGHILKGKLLVLKSKSIPHRIGKTNHRSIR